MGGAAIRPKPFQVRCMTRARLLIIAVSTITGASFAVLAGMSISAMAFPVRRFHVFSLVVAVAAIVLGYLSFRAALAGDTEEASEVDSLRAGLMGAFIALIAIVIFILGYKTGTQSFLAHALGKPTASFSTYRLLVGSVLLGFGTGFIIGVPKRLD